jgi:hypothetical protein
VPTHCIAPAPLLLELELVELLLAAVEDSLLVEPPFPPWLVSPPPHALKGTTVASARTISRIFMRRISGQDHLPEFRRWVGQMLTLASKPAPRARPTC